jgi:hypothetical protein
MLAKAAGVGLRSVQRILEAHLFAPHRIRTFKLSNEPNSPRNSRTLWVSTSGRAPEGSGETRGPRRVFA